MTLPLLRNRDARRLFLDRHALCDGGGPASGAALLDLIRRLGFVQVDSINTVARAHHMILHARRTAYRPPALTRLTETDRALFEHWTHDASIIPMEFYPHWKLRFARAETRLQARWTNWHGPEFDRETGAVLEHVRAHGACGTADVGSGEERKSGGWWEWNPSKTALEYLWHTGQLAIARRESFRKVYDLTERVVPEPHLSTTHPESHTIDWAAGAALDRLGFATSGEIAAFWAKITPAEARDWCAAALARGEIIEIAVEGADGSRRRSFARPDVLDRAAEACEPPGLVRVLSPFDPALRDRARAQRLFGFFYRIEVFVPAPKRKWGYYVFPVLEGDRLIGRIDMKAERDADRLHVTAFWPEAGVKLGRARLARLEAALDRTRRLAEVAEVSFARDWQRETLS
ncbi:winged helix-turn-helix domain-containing protein [Frigidibacter sp. ROC022]|uniref:winged helix-turn-helix domain-containing protein n=1 Tax=Frigidibacter sp. ROC022 TaxID=2971796 RepID=UPI00215A1B09|nr:crosslink repair DNA glycosylase YcaQ family protein [Frigidibacter sp. ROC022]MCR8722918.1 winged helix DNA-binding domain-containing protein [Frigidibacter sp. ROC022]